MSDREAMKLALEALEWAWGGEPIGTKEQAAMQDLRTALAAEQPKQEPVALAHCPYTPPPSAHFGYVLGDHWLETAYSRVLDGEAEVEVLKDCGWERVTDAEALRRDAERYRWMKQEVKRIPPSWDLIGWDAAIDAAMKGDKT
jgi:hypothetical protein